MKLFTTTDTIASVRKAHGDFTHVIVNRGYSTLKPAYLRTSKLMDLPVYVFAGWMPEAKGQAVKWQQGGGILIHRGLYGDAVGASDVMVFAECPLTVARIERSMSEVTGYGVIPRPHTWSVHEDCINLKLPPTDTLRRVWEAAKGQRLTDEQLGERVGLPKHHVAFLRGNLRPKEEWDIKPRLAPDIAGLLPAWEWLGRGGVFPKREASKYRKALKELSRLGHIRLDKFLTYMETEPDWEKLEAKRQTATQDLAQVRLLVESLPDHLAA